MSCTGATRSRSLLKDFGADIEPKSATFIPFRVTDNKILLEKDSAYLSNLKALPLVKRARLLDGNWNVRATAGDRFRREWFGALLERAPDDIVARCRFWDRAASEQRSGTDPDATCGVLLGKDPRGVYYVLDCRSSLQPRTRSVKEMLRCAKLDGIGTTIGFMQDPGSAGVAEAQSTARALDGFNVRFAPATGGKETRAKPVSAQTEAGNVRLIRGHWNENFIRGLENFPVGRHDDEADALSGAHEMLRESHGGFSYTRVETPSDEFRIASTWPRGRILGLKSVASFARFGLMPQSANQAESQNWNVNFNKL